MAKHLETGKIGEEAALKHLQNRGYRLLERNWRHHRCEIDLILQKDEELVFVEVKTRTRYTAQESELPGISEAQQNRIFDAAIAYTESRNHQGSIRFDLCTVLLGADGYVFEIEHLPNAFFPGMPFF